MIKILASSWILFLQQSRGVSSCTREIETTKCKMDSLASFSLQGTIRTWCANGNFYHFILQFLWFYCCWHNWWASVEFRMHTSTFYRRKIEICYYGIQVLLKKAEVLSPFNRDNNRVHRRIADWRNLARLCQLLSNYKITYSLIMLIRRPIIAPPGGTNLNRRQKTVTVDFISVPRRI